MKNPTDEIIKILDNQLESLSAELAHWKANHDNMVKRNAILLQRPDLPVDRIPAHEELINAQAELAELREEIKKMPSGYGRPRVRGNMEKAPKDKLILLHLPAFGCSAATWWNGQWSWSSEAWVIRTPFVIDNKLVVVSDIPAPLCWSELPETYFDFGQSGKGTK